jgi:signal peptidase I
LQKGFQRLLPLVILFVALTFVKTNIGQAAYIPSRSMVPTLKVHDLLIIDKMILPEELERGDIVVFRPPPESRLYKKILIKRLIGLPGDRIEIRKGKLYRNGKAIKENYIKEPMRYRLHELIVPENKYFFLGDNRNISNDSHAWSNPFVDAESIIGKAIFRIYPFDSIREM